MIFKNYDYFLTIVEEGNLSKAAEKLYISQPALSKYLKRLEVNLNINLFDHNSSPLKLTYAGEMFYKYALTILEMDKKIHKEFSELSNSQRGKITLGLALWRGSCVLPEILPSFIKRYPDIEIKVVEGRSHFLEAELLKDNIDFCIMNLVHNVDYSKLDYEVITEERILLAGNKNHPLVKKIAQSIPDSYRYVTFDLNLLKNEKLFITKPGQNLTQILYQTFSRLKFSPNNVMEIENMTTAINLVSANMGFTFIPEAGTKYGLLPSNIQLFTIDNPTLKWQLVAIYKKNGYLTKIAQLFIDELKSFYSESI